MTLTKREQTLQLVRAYAAEDGYLSQRIWRLYLERRIGHESFMAAVKAGLQAHKERTA